MNLGVAFATFALVLPAELPDKTALASLILGSRYRPSYVFAGVAAAFAVHVVLALVAGRLLALLPHRPLELVIAGLFVLGAVLMLRHQEEPDEVAELAAGRKPTFTRVAGLSFVVVLVAEFGDLTQILIMNLVARFGDEIAVGVGSLLALWAVAGLAIVGGRALLRVIPLRAVSIAGAVAMAGLAIFSLVNAFQDLAATGADRNVGSALAYFTDPARNRIRLTRSR